MARISAIRQFKTIFAILEKEFGRRERYRAHSPVEQVLLTLLLRDGKEDQGKRVIKRLEREFVDLNEVRVCVPEELDEVLGRDYPPSVGKLVTDTLTAIFNHAQAMNLDSILELDIEKAKKKLLKLRPLPSRVAGEFLLANLGCEKLPEGAGLLRVAKRTKMIKPGPADSQMKTLRRIVPKAAVPRVFHAFEMLAERICTENDFDCRACPINEHCPTGAEKLKQLQIQEEKERAAREAEEKHVKKQRDRDRRARARKRAATKKLKKTIEVRSKKLKISTRKKTRRSSRAAPPADAKMVQTSSAVVKPSRKKKRRAAKPRHRTTKKA
ncbi:MAG: hypothetical protein ABIF82_14900 [Planctomycetota bacterium]